MRLVPPGRLGGGSSRATRIIGDLLTPGRDAVERADLHVEEIGEPAVDEVAVGATERGARQLRVVQQGRSIERGRHAPQPRNSDRIGITLANLSILKTNKARAIRFTTLEALCRELKCQPGDLLEFVSGQAKRS